MLHTFGKIVTDCYLDSDFREIKLQAFFVKCFNHSEPEVTVSFMAQDPDPDPRKMLGSELQFRLLSSACIQEIATKVNYKNKFNNLYILTKVSIVCIEFAKKKKALLYPDSNK